VVPSEIPVVVGASSDRRAVLTLQHGDDRVWCFYRGEPPGTRYAFRYRSAVDEPDDNGDVCDANSRPHAGDAVTVDRVALRVLNGDSTNAAGKTTVRVTLEVRCGDGGATDASSDVADVYTSDVTDATTEAPVEASAEANLCAGVVCQAQDACHVAGTCDPNTGQCSNPAASDGTSCDDGNACTQVDRCQSGVCVGTHAVVCGASDQCHIAGSCDPSTGACTNPAAPNGTACNDGNACTPSDTCQNGACVGADPVVCTALDQCHGVGACDPGTGTCSTSALLHR
jgi:hypothetical protein